MSTTPPDQDPTILGLCPECRTEIVTYNVLIEYETEDGNQATWAECPGCGKVVHPEDPETG